MVQILQAFSRIVIAIISGAMMIFGAVYLADLLAGPEDDALAAVGSMLKENPTRLMVLSLAGVSAYAIGTVNVTLSNLLFTWRVRVQSDDLQVVSQVESFKKPQLLNEALDLLNVRRTLVAYALPLCWLGLWMANDHKQWKGPKIPLIAGFTLMIMGILAPILAWRISHRIDSTLKTLSANPSE